MARIENETGNLRATLDAMDESELIAQQIVQQGAMHALETLVAHGCSEQTAQDMLASLKHLREHAEQFKHLFPDTAALVLKAPEDLQAQVAARIAEHRAAEEKRLESERARIRAEEEARARAQAEHEQQEREAAERRQREEQEAAQRRPEEQQRQQAAAPNPEQQAAPANAANVLPMPTRAPAAPASAPSVRLGQINQRLAPLAVDAASLAALGFPHSATEGAAKLWHEHQFGPICSALIAHIAKCRDQRQAA